MLSKVIYKTRNWPTSSKNICFWKWIDWTWAFNNDVFLDPTWMYDNTYVCCCDSSWLCNYVNVNAVAASNLSKITCLLPILTLHPILPIWPSLHFLVSWEDRTWRESRSEINFWFRAEWIAFCGLSSDWANNSHTAPRVLNHIVKIRLKFPFRVCITSWGCYS